MTRKIRAMVASFLMIFSMGAASLTIAAPLAAAAGSSCNTHFLTFPAWYDGLTDGDCNIQSPEKVGGLTKFIWAIVLNVLEILLQVVGYVSTVMILVGGFRFLTSAGNPTGIEAGKKTLTNAIIGLVIAIASIAIVNLLFGVITGLKP